jgi:hypothetical protein
MHNLQCVTEQFNRNWQSSTHATTTTSDTIDKVLYDASRPTDDSEALAARDRGMSVTPYSLFCFVLFVCFV